MIFFYLFLSTLNSALASFFLLALVFIDIQNSTANSSTNFLFIKVGNLRKINNNMKFSHKIDKNLMRRSARHLNTCNRVFHDTRFCQII